MRYQLSALLSREIEAAVKSILRYVDRHIAADETILNVQVLSHIKIWYVFLP